MAFSVLFRSNQHVAFGTDMESLVSFLMCKTFGRKGLIVRGCIRGVQNSKKRECTFHTGIVSSN